jgi:hypothetical protein
MSVSWQQDGIKVTSWGNGLAYLIAAPDGREVFLQGDDATDWRAAYDVADLQEEGASPFLKQTLADHCT